MTAWFVFLAGFSMMAFELLAARLMAPFLGSSLHTWTAVIASILLGIVLGAPLGGWLADRGRPVRVLGWLLVGSGVASASAYLVAYLIGPLFAPLALPLPILTTIFCLLVFFPPALLSGSITPVAVRATLNALDSTGRVVGSLGAWNAAGSILGVYLTGFVFQAYFSTRLVWLVLSALLIVAGLIWLWRSRRV